MIKINLFFISALVLTAGCMPQGQYNQEVQENQKLAYLNATYQQLNQALKAEVAADQVQIQQLQDELQVTMVNEILFPVGIVPLTKGGIYSSATQLKIEKPLSCTNLNIKLWKN